MIFLNTSHSLDTLNVNAQFLQLYYMKIMKNIVIIQRAIVPSPYLKKIYNRWNDLGLGSYSKVISEETKDPYGFLPLVWAKVTEGESPKDSNFLEQTPGCSSITP